MRYVILLMGLLLGGLQAGSSTALAVSPPQVVVSIKPVHALVAEIMQGVAEPQLLIEGGGSPHGYALRPSEARALAEADLIIWVGEALESFLVKPLATLGSKARHLELGDELKERLLPLRAGGRWEAHEEHGEGHHHEHEHDQGDWNPHLWLDPLLAQQVVSVTAAALADLDPRHRQHYLHNAEQLSRRLTELHNKLQSRLAPVREVPYLVFHDAYQYFEAAFSLNPIGSITVNPERRPGAKRIWQMREKIKSSGAVCVFREPQFEPRLVATVVEGTGARTGVLDPLGAALPTGPESYFLLLRNLADNLVACLSPDAPR